MKTLLFVACVFCAASAFGQSSSCLGVMNNQPTVLHVDSHPQRARQANMGMQESLLETSSNSAGKGTRPLWEFSTGQEPEPLGNIAREFRKQRITAKKAEVVWSN
jgi:hypothetical protein